jgi:hypothetical protein
MQLVWSETTSAILGSSNTGEVSLYCRNIEPGPPGGHIVIVLCATS